VFLYTQPDVFLFSTPNKTVILSEAPRRSIAKGTAYGAESKDLGGAYLTHAARSFSTTEARQQDLAAVRS
jgi:hypothetical protein